MNKNLSLTKKMKSMGFKCQDNSSSGKKRIFKNQKAIRQPKKQCDWVASNKITSDSICSKQILLEDMDQNNDILILSPQVGAFGECTQSTTSVTAGKQSLNIEEDYNISFSHTEDMSQ